VVSPSLSPGSDERGVARFGATGPQLPAKALPSPLANVVVSPVPSP
jgi:hypothetical protein